MRLLFVFLFFCSCSKSQVVINADRPSGITINQPGGRSNVKINHTFTPLTGDTILLYILFGQSNVGRARTSLMSVPQQAYSGLVPNTRIFNPYISTSTLSAMNVGVNTMLADANTIDEYGPEASLFKNLQTNDPRERVLLKYGDGATSMRSFWSSRSPKPGYINLLNYINTVVNLIIAEGKIPILEQMIFMQGEGDAGSESFANQYYSRLTDLNTDLRANWQNIINANSLPQHDYEFVIGRINSPTALYRDAVRTAQFDFCAIPANMARMIDCDPYPLFDIVHYNETGQIMFGDDIYN